jgi:hypothetical protein
MMPEYFDFDRSFALGLCLSSHFDSGSGFGPDSDFDFDYIHLVLTSVAQS